MGYVSWYFLCVKNAYSEEIWLQVQDSASASARFFRDWFDHIKSNIHLFLAR